MGLSQAIGESANLAMSWHYAGRVFPKLEVTTTSTTSLYARYMYRTLR